MGQGSMKFYMGLFILGMGLGVPLSWIRHAPWVEMEFNRYEYIQSFPLDLYELVRSLRALGIFGLIMIMYKSGWFQWLFRLLRPVGQMAFTNYLTQSFMCGLYFYGIGFGMFGKLQYYEMYYVVGVVWLIQILWSHLWLKYFLFGPLEWLWRSLTYWSWQPMRRKG